MSKINYKKIAAFVITLGIFVPMFFVLADNPQAAPVKLDNPLGAGNDTVEKVLLKIMDIVTIIGSIVVVFFIIYSGFTFVMAQGNPEGLKKAKEMLLATVIGGAILLGADVIANVVVGTVKSLK